MAEHWTLGRPTYMTASGRFETLARHETRLTFRHFDMRSINGFENKILVRQVDVISQSRKSGWWGWGGVETAWLARTRGLPDYIAR
jgi:hypothetical protein